MDDWGLPTSTVIGGEEFVIRADFRDVLNILCILEDAELNDNERGALALEIFYPDFDKLNKDNAKEAAEYMQWFLNGGEMSTKRPKMKLADWKQDFPYIISPVNKVLGYEARAAEFVHWWTFLAAYCEIGECFFAHVVAIRKKKRAGKKLEKWERDFYRENRDKIDFQTQLTTDELDFLKSLEKGV